MRIKTKIYFLFSSIKFKIISLYRDLSPEEKIVRSLCTKDGMEMLSKAMTEPIRKRLAERQNETENNIATSN